MMTSKEKKYKKWNHTKQQQNRKSNKWNNFMLQLILDISFNIQMDE